MIKLLKNFFRRKEKLPPHMPQEPGKYYMGNSIYPDDVIWFKGELCVADVDSGPCPLKYLTHVKFEKAYE